MATEFAIGITSVALGRQILGPWDVPSGTHSAALSLAMGALLAGQLTVWVESSDGGSVWRQIGSVTYTAPQLGAFVLNVALGTIGESTRRRTGTSGSIRAIVGSPAAFVSAGGSLTVDQ